MTPPPDDAPLMAAELEAGAFVEDPPNLAAALRLVEVLGVRVFPVYGRRADGSCACGDAECGSPAKHPMVKGWQNVASADPSTVRAVFLRAGPLANIGIATGAASGVFVLDSDGEAGKRTLAKLEAEHGTLPTTITVCTARGLHFLFAYDGTTPIRNSAGRAGPGVDGRSDGGFVVAVGSVHASGHVYAWERGRGPDSVGLATMPEWLVALLVDAPSAGTGAQVALPTEPTNGHAQSAGSPITEQSARADRRRQEYFEAKIARAASTLAATAEGKRNDQLYNAARYLAGYFHAGLDRHEARRALELAAQKAGLPPGETQRTIASAFAAGEKMPLAVQDFDDGDLEPLFATGLPIGVAAGTDLATAYLLREHHGDDLMYCAELGWLAWDGRRFVADGTCGPSLRVQNIGRRLELGAAELLRRAAQLEDESERKEVKAQAGRLAAWAHNVQSAAGIRRGLEVAQTLVVVSPDQLDSDPTLLTVLNGTLELATGTLREHRREDKLTLLAPVHYDPNARAPRWEKFLEEILPDADVRAFVLRFLGYALTGDVSEHAFVVGLGSGANGKSVLTEAMRRVLGDYARDLPTDSLMCTKYGTRGPGNDVARLKGARFVTAKETEQDRRLDEPRVKSLTGGDTISARFLYREFFEFRPHFKLWLHCNHRPVIRGTDDGVWRRIYLVPFGVKFGGEQRDPALTDKLSLEASGILASLVRACLEWRKLGLKPPTAVTAATAAWRQESDDVAAFVAECCVVGPRYSVKSDDLYAAYVAWAAPDGGGAHVLSKIAFGWRLAELGYESGKSNTRGRVWKGLGVPAKPEANTGADSNTGQFS